MDTEKAEYGKRTRLDAAENLTGQKHSVFIPNMMMSMQLGERKGAR